MKCLILAGGFGRRLYPVIGEKPKALLEYLGRPLITHIVQKIPPEIEILVTTNRKFEAELVCWKETAPRPVEILVEEARSEDEKPGALSAIAWWVEKRHLREDLMVIAADNYFEFDIGQFLEAYDGRHTLVATYDTQDTAKARNYGVVKLEGDRIVEFVEKPAHPESTVVATACYIFPPRVLEICRSYCREGKRDLLGGFIAHLVETDEVCSFLFEEKWFDIGSEIKA